MKGLQLHITADKREIKDFPKLPSATSFIRKTLGAILLEESNVIENHLILIISVEHLEKTESFYKL